LIRRRRKRPRNQAQKPGLGVPALEAASGEELEELALPVVVPKFPGIDEEDQIIARLDTMLVQAENFPDLTFRSVSFNGISEFLG